MALKARASIYKVLNATCWDTQIDLISKRRPAPGRHRVISNTSHAIIIILSRCRSISMWLKCNIICIPAAAVYPLIGVLKPPIKQKGWGGQGSRDMDGSTCFLYRNKDQCGCLGHQVCQVVECSTWWWTRQKRSSLPRGSLLLYVKHAIIGDLNRSQQRDMLGLNKGLVEMRSWVNRKMNDWNTKHFHSYKLTALKSAGIHFISCDE